VVRQVAEKQRIEVIYESSVGTAMIHADARRLEQCLVKLLSNAAKFTPPGGRIGLNVKIDSLEGSLMIVVWDTGIGISEADQAQLFQPFFQASSGSVRRYDGTGLGLSLTKKLVELHGGTLHVESSIGQGSQFEISLPWEDPRAIAATTLQGPKRRTSNPASNQPLALIVDDNALSIEPVCQYLEAKGYSIAFTRTGPGAMDIIRMRQPAVIFMDIQMPHVLGFDTIRQLRSNPTSARIPIIAVAGFSEPGKREKCLEVGADDYVAKPVVLRDVGTMLRRLVMEKSRLN
jgi:CheY-like chemotaxis protein/anti-sigma regulatory factor (Ser/Thr protein kinase)